MNRLILLCLFACLCGRTASGQSLDSSISDYSNRFPDEKIHVHFDKDNYLPGETVWMRGYLLSGSHPSGLSKNLYFSLAYVSDYPDYSFTFHRIRSYSVSQKANFGAC